jgi:phosphate/sulfate permease
MDNFYLILVGVLFILAISDLIVGVSNDAVNFLNSALGSKAAPRYVIMIIASLGVLIGATFSNGMMEVARKGIFHPEFFHFNEIMILFMAVMLTDILLLDMFNTLGLPTSTTVSIVFELLGAAVGLSIIKMSGGGETIVVNGIEKIAEMGDYINTAKALAIISGILLSVVVAFTIGSLIQYFTRLIFSFNFERTYKYFGAIWGGIAITAITYFIVIKGAKGSSFVTKETLDWIKDNTLIIVTASFAIWAVLLQLIMLTTKINIFKLIVLVGTFALAMAFAGNDLVNFIGVPLAGLKAFETYQTAGADDILMTALTGKTQTNTYYLIIAGLVMVITLWLSKKARTVTETELNLSRQNDGDERFGSSVFARLLVRNTVKLNNNIKKVLPASAVNAIDKRFDQSAAKTMKAKANPMFDLVRASVNLTVASILISFATSLKLPLSTTYVTFMVAMGTSLADRAWGRESAVYRITGVLTVIGGWFFTAFLAFSAAFLVAIILYFGGKIAVVGLILLAILLLVKSHLYHKKKSNENGNNTDEEVEDDNIVENCTNSVKKSLENIIDIYGKTISGLTKDDRKKLKKVKADVFELNAHSKRLKANVYSTIKKLREDSIETGHYYVQVIDYLREISHCLDFIAAPSFEHIDNNHKGLSENQIDELLKTKANLIDLFKMVTVIIDKNDYNQIPDVIEKQQDILYQLNQNRKNQIKRIKKEESGTRNSILYLGIINETKNLLLQTINLLKSQRDFIMYNKK